MKFIIMLNRNNKGKNNCSYFFTFAKLNYVFASRDAAWFATGQVYLRAYYIIGEICQMHGKSPGCYTFTGLYFMVTVVFLVYQLT